MIIKSDGLTKRFGEFVAVDHLDFEMDVGEIVGLLGPNGAGKTTTMRMLTCFLPATEGTATVAGYDIFSDPIEVRRSIGYMPESNPLYTEMRVNEYLSFRARLKGVPRRDRIRRMEHCMERCSLADVRFQVIRTLSKGYRQRVGLADAMLNDPRILILDEPTIGLDPNQIRQTRQTIRDLGELHTILISTHILQEVEAICKRVLIINRGRVVADDTPSSLSQQVHGNVVEVEVQAAADAVRRAFGDLPGVREATVSAADGWTRAAVAPQDGQADLREAVFQCVVANGWILRELIRRRISLEDVFHKVTLGDQPAAED